MTLTLYLSGLPTTIFNSSVNILNSTPLDRVEVFKYLISSDLSCA